MGVGKLGGLALPLALSICPSDGHLSIRAGELQEQGIAKKSIRSRIRMIPKPSGKAELNMAAEIRIYVRSIAVGLIEQGIIRGMASTKQVPRGSAWP